MKLNLDLTVLDENGEEVGDQNVAQIVAGRLMRNASKEESDILKFFSWAQDLSKNNELDLDKGDLKKLRKFILEDDMMFIVVKAPAIEAIDALVAKADTKEKK